MNFLPIYAILQDLLISDNIIVAESIWKGIEHGWTIYRLSLIAIPLNWQVRVIWFFFWQTGKEEKGVSERETKGLLEKIKK